MNSPHDNFLPFHPLSDDALRRSVAARKGRRVSPELLRILREQNASLAPSPERARALELLAEPDAVCVITGQQVGLFGGPLLTYYKALTAVLFARRITALTGIPAVPIFWLQAEDHDLAEANIAYVPGAKGELSALRIEAGHFPDRVPLHYLPLGEGVLATRQALRSELGHHVHAEEILSLIDASYVPSRTFPEAFAALFSALFANDGLIFFNPRWATQLAESREVFRRALSGHAEIARALLERSAELEAQGIAPQVHVRARSPLFFFSPQSDGDGGEEHARVRLEAETDASDTPFRFVGVTGGVSSATLTRALEEQPERFSTSALLRPILQESLFPCAAYVGGEAEGRYFAQVSALAKHFVVPDPCVVPRASFLLLEPRIAELLNELQLSPAELNLSDVEIFERIAKNGGVASADELRDEFLAGVRPAFERLSERVAAADKTLRQPAEKTEAKLKEQLNGLLDRYREALGRLDSVRSERLKKVQLHVRPQGKDQERVLSLSYSWARYGRELDATLRSHVQLFETQRKEILL